MRVINLYTAIFTVLLGRVLSQRATVSGDIWGELSWLCDTGNLTGCPIGMNYSSLIRVILTGLLMPGIGQKLVENVVFLKQLLWLCSVRGKPALFVPFHTIENCRVSPVAPFWMKHN